jgi:uncharacterized protein YraI
MRKYLIGVLLVAFAVTPFVPRLVTAQTCGSPNWEGRYFNNVDLSGSPVQTICSPVIDFNWGIGSPAGGVNPDNFGVRWTSTQVFPASGTYLFTVTVEDGVRLYINGNPVINSMQDSPEPRTLSTTYEVTTSGAAVFMTLEMNNYVGNAQIKLTWSLTTGGTAPPGTGPTVPTTGGGFEWTIEYFNNLALTAPAAATGTAPANGISRNYQRNAPAPQLPADGWSARWTRIVDFPAGTYTFSGRADDGMTVTVDGVVVINQASFAFGQTFTGTIDLTAGQHTIVVTHFDEQLDADLFLTWEPAVGTTLRPDGCNGETAGINGSAPPCPELSGPTITLSAVVRAGPLNFRPRPDKSSGRIKMLHRGEEYTAVGRSGDNIWVQLDVNGTKGWSMTEFLTLSGDINTLAVTDGTQSSGTPSAAATTTPPTPVFTGVQAQALGNMRLRAAPNTRSDRVGGVNWGQIVNVLGRSANGEWIFVEINGLQGWTSLRWYKVTQGSMDSVPVLQ